MAQREIFESHTAAPVKRARRNVHRPIPRIIRLPGIKHGAWPRLYRMRCGVEVER